MTGCLPAGPTRLRGSSALPSPESTPASANRWSPRTVCPEFGAAITVDNDGYGRFSGEVQLVRSDLPVDGRVNVAGWRTLAAFWRTVSAEEINLF